MTLTANQTDWLADFDANVAAFRTAIEASMEADLPVITRRNYTY